MSYTYAGQFGPEAILSAGGALLPSVTVTVFQSDGSTPATLYTTRTKSATAANPTTTDSRGNVKVFADPGNYVLDFGGGSTFSVVVPVDPAEHATVFNVLGFGALGNGSNDDTSEIQSAIAAAVAAGGGIVYLPPGDFRISSALTIDANNVTVAGAGPYATQIVTTSTTADVFTLGNGSTERDYITVRDLRISTTVTRTAGAAFNCNLIGRSTFENVNLNAQFTGYWLQNGCPSLFIRNGVWGSTAANGVGLLCAGANDIYVDNIVHDTAGTQPRAGIEVTACGGSLVVSNCDFIHAGYGLLIDPGNGQTVNWLWFNSVAFDFCTNNGIRVAPSGTGVVKGLMFASCWTSSCTGAGVSFSNSSNIDGANFLGHVANTNGTQGFSFLGGKNIKLNGCVVAGNSTASSGASDGIFIQNSVTNWAITNCRIGNAWGTGTTQRAAVFINGTSPDYFTIADNDMTGNNNSPVLVDGTSSANKRIRGNIGFNPLGHSVTQPAVPASTVTATNNSGVDCMVHLAGGTISAITVGGSATGLTTTPATIQVPAGQTVAVTYTVAPTWQWFGD